MEGDGWHTVDRECEVCHREAVGYVQVSKDVHPDQRIIVCGDCGQFVIDAICDIGALIFMADTGRLSL